MEPFSLLLDSLLERGRAHRPLVGAHRGSSARAPENTLFAFRAAIDDGADLIELDVQITRDGALAVIHDESTRRTTGIDGIVAAMTMADLRHLNAAHFRGTSWPREPVPELGEVLGEVRGRVLVNVEIKGGPAAVPVVAQRVAAAGMADSVIISSFDPKTARVASWLAPPLLTGLLLDQPVSDSVATTRAVGAALLHAGHRLIDAALVDALHAAGIGILAWTVNAPHEIERLSALGVDIILTDDPRLLQQRRK